MGIGRFLARVIARRGNKASAGVKSAAAAGGAASAVTETVTVVLRRQIPPRFGEPPRSWLGGLPMLPDGAPWPRSVSCEHPEQGERPLHFVAQICCDDLPPSLWAGLGPRRGWLLLFIDPNQGAPDGPDAFCILHTDTLGSERAPPADLGPVHDGVYTGWDYDYCGDEASVPRVWRRWPVDLVAMSNEAHIEGRQVRVAPPDLAQRLYDGAPVAEAGVRLPAPAPFTRRGAVYALNAALYRCGKPTAPRPLPDKLVTALREPGCLDGIRARLEARRERLRERQSAGPAPGDSTSHGAALEREIARVDALLAFLSGQITPLALIAHAEDAQARLCVWQADCHARLARLRDAWANGEPDAPVTAAAWATLQAEAAGKPYRAIGVRWDYGSTGPGDTTPNINLITLFPQPICLNGKVLFGSRVDVGQLEQPVGHRRGAQGCPGQAR